VKEKKKGAARDLPFPPAKTSEPGRWTRIAADDGNAASGGGRRTVTTEVMPVPSGHGWVMRSIVATAEGHVAVALCYVPRK
jgi:hypothetical protein